MRGIINGAKRITSALKRVHQGHEERHGVRHSVRETGRRNTVSSVFGYQQAT
jgi:hypothetical protein